jgi:hypothetical protein
MKRHAWIALLLAFAGSPLWAIDCSTIPANLVVNCGFDAGVASWTLAVGGGFQASGGGQNGVGARFDGDPSGNSKLLSSCVVAQQGAKFALGIAVTNDGPASTPTCTVGLQEFSDAACATPLAYAPDSPAELVDDGVFHDLAGNHVVGAGVGSVAVALVCGQAVSGSEQRVDNGFLVAQLDVIAVPVSPAGLAFFAATLAIAALAVLRLSR